MMHEARKGDFLTRAWPSTVRTPRLNEKEFLADVLRPFHDALVKALVVFRPDEEGRDRGIDDLSDGQRSLFHIAMTAATLDVERRLAGGGEGFQAENVPLPALTLVALEEPENNLAPFYLSRIIRQLQDLASDRRAQQINGPKNRLRIGATGVDLAPAFGDGARNKLNRRFLAKNLVQRSTCAGELFAYLVRPGDRAPQPAPQEAAHLGGPIARCRDVDHLDTRPVDGVKVRAILIIEVTQCSYGAILHVDRALHRAVIGPLRFEPESAFQHAIFICRHLLEKLRCGVVVAVDLRQLRKREDRFKHKVALRGSFLLAGRHMKILAPHPPMVAGNAKHAQQRKHHRRLAGTVGAHESSQLRAATDGLWLGPEAAEVDESQAFKMNSSFSQMRRSASRPAGRYGYARLAPD
jgi:AAA domain, putative AbiEii toxin, Type IV TA system